jgi:amino acid transporter
VTENLPNDGLGATVRRRGSFGRTLRAVFWSFFGVRKSSDLQKDVEQLNPVHVIVAGIIGAMLLVAGLLALVSWVLSSGVAK